jgi:hypothetical protein
MFTKTKIALAGPVVLSTAAAVSVAIILRTASTATAATKHHRHHQLAPTIPQ